MGDTTDGRVAWRAEGQHIGAADGELDARLHIRREYFIDTDIKKSQRSLPRAEINGHFHIGCNGIHLGLSIRAVPTARVAPVEGGTTTRQRGRVGQ